jgi:hypothetical protein
MDTKEIAKYVDETLTKLYKERKQAIDDIEKLVLKWWEELFPIMEVMQKHKVYFKNLELEERQTLRGILVGRTFEPIKPRLLVLNGLRVYYVNMCTDETNETESVSLKKYIETADLKYLKSGFDFVRGIKINIEERARTLQEFLRENG